MDAPHSTPPPIVRPVTHEDLSRDIAELRKFRGEDYTSLRSIESRMEAHHLAQMEQLGILARAVNGLAPRQSFWRRIFG